MTWLGLAWLGMKYTPFVGFMLASLLRSTQMELQRIIQMHRGSGCFTQIDSIEWLVCLIQCASNSSSIRKRDTKNEKIKNKTISPRRNDKHRPPSKHSNSLCVPFHLKWIHVLLIAIRFEHFSSRGLNFT